MNIERIALFLIGFLSITFKVYAQTNTVDSLKAILKETSTDSSQLSLKLALADAFLKSEQNDSSVQYFENIIETHQAQLSELEQAEVYQKLGLLFQYKGQFKVANEYNFKSLSIKEKINASPEALAASHSNIALSYQELEQFEKAIEHQKISLSYFLQVNDSSNIAMRYYMIGGVLYQTEAYDSAKIYYDKAYQMYIQLGRKDFISIYHTYVGLIHLKKDRLFEAEEAFLQSLNTYPEGGPKRTKVFIYSNLAVVYLIIGAERDSIGKFYLKQCVSYAQKTYTLAEELSFIRQMRKASEILYKAYDALGLYKDAVKFSKEYILLNDSMYKEQEQEAIAEIQTKYETEKKELEINLLNKENTLKENQLLQSEAAKKRQSLYTVITVIGLIIVIAISLFVYRLYRQKRRGVEELSKKNEIISKQKEKNEVLLKEIHHRVKNNLQVISSLLDLQSENISDKKALSAVEDGQSRVKAMALIHQKLYQNDEVENISFKAYADQLCKQVAAVYALDKNVTVAIESEEVYLDIDTAVPLGLILNELVSNAYKYAFNEIKEGKLLIRLTKEKETIGEYSLLVADNGIGLPEEFEWSKSRSLGLRLVYRLSKQLFGSATYYNKKGANFKVNFKDTIRRKATL